MTVVSPDLVDWAERQYLSQFSMPPLILQTHIGGVLADPDGSVVSAQLLLQNPDGTTTPVNSYSATRTGQGVYQIIPSSSDTSVPADAILNWSFLISGVAQQAASLLTIGQANPFYDNLPVDMQQFIETQLWARFRDLFDSPDGGPNLQTYFQSHWSRGRVAQMVTIAISKINSIAQPWSNYSIDGQLGPEFPIQLWGGLLSTYAYCECVKHLIRSYVEQPELQGGGGITRQERRDYAERWRMVLQDEQAELKSLLDVFKIRHMGLGNPRVLVSGGTYGRYAPTRIAGSVAARPRMWARWKPLVLNGAALLAGDISTIMQYACPHDRPKSQGQALAHRTCRHRSPVLVQGGSIRWRGCLLAVAFRDSVRWLWSAQLEVARRPLQGPRRSLGTVSWPGDSQRPGDRPQARRRSYLPQPGPDLSRRQDLPAPPLL